METQIPMDFETAIPTDSLWISEVVPESLAQVARESGIQVVTSSEVATMRLDLDMNGINVNDGGIIWVYALVTPFPTLMEGIQSDDLKSTWQGRESSSLSGKPVWMDESTRVGLSVLWGEPDPAFMLRTEDPEKILDSAWAEQPSFAIIPFEEIEPRWKVLTIDGQSPIHKDFDPGEYPLTISFRLTGDGVERIGFNLPANNRDPEKLTTVVMTGVTALVRATADEMETHGRTYPGEAIRKWLLEADITHISNEVAFAPDCPSPDRYQVSLFFCSDPRNIQLLEYVGTDIVELTGNHIQDWGSKATLYTLGLYNQHSWAYFGGGENLQDARKSITLEHNGNKIAFIGCNPSGPDYAWATDSEPGAAPCDLEWMQAEITRLRSEGYLPITTLQYFEGYSAWPGPRQKVDFRVMADAGAVIVSGSQAHFPMTMEFYNGSFIHYGLGNLFFDQMDFPVIGTRREFIDRHVFYEGRYINTELLTAMLEDYSRPRPMTEDERLLFLGEIFSVSGW
jgi:hypothetical protein